MDANYLYENAFFSSPLRFGDIILMQLGRAYCNSKTLIDTHVQRDLFELTVVTEGVGFVSANGFPSRVEAGDIFLSFPGETHRIESDPERLLKFDFFAFRCENTEWKTALDRIVETHYAPGKRICRDERIRHLIGNALAELGHEALYSEALLSSIFSQIVIYLIRQYRENTVPKQPDKVTSAEALCYRMMHYIDTHLYSMRSLRELSPVTGYSYGYISTLFKSTTSNTLLRYYSEKKLDAARLLILEHRLNMTEISELLGYASVYAFSKAFRNRFGMSPRNYYNQHAECENIRMKTI